MEIPSEDSPIVTFATAQTVLEAGDMTGRVMISQPTMDLVQLVLDPGAYLAPHPTPMDVVFFIHEGDGKVILGEELILVKRGDAIACPGNTAHGLWNTGDSFLRVLVMKLTSQVAGTEV